MIRFLVGTILAIITLWMLLLTCGFFIKVMTPPPSQHQPVKHMQR